MENKVFLSRDKNKYKGNLHTHSIRSDGSHIPEIIVKRYKDKGYSFICLSDHEIYYNDTSLNTNDFVCLSGYEMRVENKIDNESFHIHGLLDYSIPCLREFQHDEYHEIPEYTGDLQQVQELMDQMISYGNLLIFNHPNWSRNSYEALAILKNFHFMEIYNHQSEITEAVGYSLDYWDYCLRKNIKLFGVATDDMHQMGSGEELGEAFGGYIVCDGSALSQEKIIDSIRQGAFYSSQGPEIYDLRIENNILKIETSGVKFIKFIVYETLGNTHFSKDSSLINYGEYIIKGHEKYIRVELMDDKGLRAWSNPVFIEGGNCD